MRFWINIISCFLIHQKKDKWMIKQNDIYIGQTFAIVVSKRMNMINHSQNMRTYLCNPDCIQIKTWKLRNIFFICVYFIKRHCKDETSLGSWYCTSTTNEQYSFRFLFWKKFSQQRSWHLQCGNSEDCAAATNAGMIMLMTWMGCLFVI